PEEPRTRRSLVIRVGSAAILLAFIMGGFALGQLATYIVLGALIMIGVVEFYLITRRMGSPAAPWVLFPLTLVFLLRFQLDRYSPAIVPGVITASVVLGLGGFLLARRPIDGMTRWAFAVAGSLYLGWSLGYYFAIFGVHDPDPARIGTAWLVSLAGSTTIGDTAALLVGSRYGRHPFFPQISPRKTLEGAIGGFVAQTIFFALMVQLADVPLVHGLVLGALISVVAQAGDLIESQFKRAARVKDASSFIPGHGGMLDRIDSLVLIPAVAYYYMALVLHTPLPQ
ncbi:MAG: phosphatidate cytidylyltransferase, partial [Candidatus Dormibacteraeota bacterium]|nr:phosphatidate cytidylyltransferase [Candidatus Dormibacteraeota bacterium]